MKQACIVDKRVGVIMCACMFFIFLVIFMVIDMSDKKIPACAKCKVTKCRYPESKGGVPDFCAMKLP